MPSPFPGMDPWLESPRYFGDLHDSLIYNLQASLQPLLPAPYFASKSARVWLEIAERPIEPDVYIVREPAGQRLDDFPSVATIGETGPLLVVAEPNRRVDPSHRTSRSNERHFPDQRHPGTDQCARTPSV